MLKKNLKIKFLYIFPFILSILIVPVNCNKYKYPVYKVVIDPGHGGISMNPKSIHGDRYDLISKKYLYHFKSGAAYKSLEEHILMYDIAVKVKKILQYCSPQGDYTKFLKILKKYSSIEPERIYIFSKLSRKKSISRKSAGKMKDPNKDYRLFDYPLKNKILPGRISKINEYKPHLVVSLHCATYPSYKGMNPILAAPHSLLDKGRKYLKGEIKDKNFFYDSGLSDWFRESNSRSTFQWFLNDANTYFTGYPLTKRNIVRRDKFKGYRWNMVTWPYRDINGWEKIAKSHPKKTRYSWNYKNYLPEGKFWDREKSKFEEYKRDKGSEGFGGDNSYASYELIRYMLYALKLHGYDHKSQLPGKSYVSTWIMPIHVNAINPYIELGYFIRKRDRYLLTKRQNEIAEGLAVGIYSLFTGIKLNKNSYKHIPRGKKINLEKYKISDDNSYFDFKPYTK